MQLDLMSTKMWVLNTWLEIYSTFHVFLFLEAPLCILRHVKYLVCLRVVQKQLSVSGKV